MHSQRRSKTSIIPQALTMTGSLTWCSNPKRRGREYGGSVRGKVIKLRKSQSLLWELVYPHRTLRGCNGKSELV